MQSVQNLLFRGDLKQRPGKKTLNEQNISDHCVHQPSLALVLAERIGLSKKYLEKATAYFKLLRSNHQKGRTSYIADDCVTPAVPNLGVSTFSTIAFIPRSRCCQGHNCSRIISTFFRPINTQLFANLALLDNYRFISFLISFLLCTLSLIRLRT